jgi:ABC-type bacteriocin/lantibiotic exporter with double-glycine peptidase domain
VTRAPFLVLDEPTSALDPDHERRLVETLQRLKGRRSIILVTHRYEAVAACDRVFRIEAGAILEQPPRNAEPGFASERRNPLHLTADQHTRFLPTAS